MRLFSVVVTTLDMAPYVRRTLDSAWGATLALREHPGAPDVELLVVDDGSRDDTPRIAEEAAEGRPNWRVLRRPSPSSPSAARNFGAAQAEGDVLFFLDGDDLFLPEHLEVCWRALEGADFVKTGVRLADRVHPDWVPRIEGSVVLNLAVRRHCHEAVGGFPDWHLFRREGDGFRHELDVFYKLEDQFYCRALAGRFRGVGVARQTVEYVRRPGNSFDRQLEKFRRPFAQATPPSDHTERLRLRVAEAISAEMPLVREEQPVWAFDQPACRAESEARAALAEGDRLAEKGDRAGAVECYGRALAGWPGLAEAEHGLGLALAQSGRPAEGVEHLRRAALAQPGNAAWRHNLGVALAQCGRAGEAEGELRAALQARPDYPEALYNLGGVLAGRGRREEAVDVYRRAVALRPGYFEALNNLGLSLTEAGRHEEALPYLRHALRLRPALPEAHNNLALALAGCGRFGEAEAAYGEALRLAPGNAEAHVNLAGLYREAGRLEEALAAYSLAVDVAPGEPSARYNSSLALLQAGRWGEGWPEYEFRWQRKATPRRALPAPEWDGSALEGKTLLVFCEQGLGDCIQFARYAPLCAERGARVVLECPPPLLPLFSTLAGVERLVPEGQEVPPHDFHVPLMSLPRLFGTTPESVPAQVPYLSAEPARVGRWRERLAGVTGFRVGVVWQGNPRFEKDRWRSFPLRLLAPLAGVPGVRLVSLQKGPGEEQLGALGGAFAIERLEGLDEGAPFLDTAAAMKCLDLVVAADTSAGHLAGALGVPAWLALGASADWRWLEGRGDTPWYPSMRLFRQARLGGWGEVFERMAAELAKAVAARGGRGLARLEVSAGELADRISILRIKAERIQDAGKRAHVLAELAASEAAQREAGPWPEAVAQMEARLREVNEGLWDVEDALRVREREGDFGAGFVELARSVYRLNDERGRLKRQISEAAGSPWAEQKQYGGA